MPPGAIIVPTSEMMLLTSCKLAVVSLLLSLEAFFGAMFGTLLLGQLMTGRELLGCGLMIAATLIAELPMPVKKK